MDYLFVDEMIYMISITDSSPWKTISSRYGLCGA